MEECRERPETSAGKFGEELLCVPKRECIAKGFVLAQCQTRNNFCTEKHMGGGDGSTSTMFLGCVARTQSFV